MGFPSRTAKIFSAANLAIFTRTETSALPTWGVKTTRKKKHCFKWNNQYYTNPHIYIHIETCTLSWSGHNVYRERIFVICSCLDHNMCKIHSAPYAKKHDRDSNIGNIEKSFKVFEEI